MILYIDTTDNDIVKLALKNGSEFIAQKKFKARFRQAEKLLPEIDKLLKSKKLDLKQINQIVVANKGGSFTSLRIGVVTANALGFALNIPVKKRVKTESKTELVEKRIKKYHNKNKGKNIDIVVPEYEREPNITVKKPR